MNIFLVGLGGAFGAMARFALGNILPASLFGLPLQILIINVLGCLTIGALTELTALFWYPSMHMKAFLFPGLLGGFTTFSAFALEFGDLFEKNLPFTAIIYAVCSVVLSLAAFFIGLKIVRLFA